MTPQQKSEWLAALRGGEYEQCRSVLHDSTGYCCLGVLWDTQREWHDEERGVAKPVSGSFVSLFNEEFGLPYEVTRRLARMNDNGASFAQIADYIEREIEPVSLVNEGALK